MLERQIQFLSNSSPISKQRTGTPRASPPTSSESPNTPIYNSPTVGKTNRFPTPYPKKVQPDSTSNRNSISQSNSHSSDDFIEIPSPTIRNRFLPHSFQSPTPQVYNSPPQQISISSENTSDTILATPITYAKALTSKSPVPFRLLRSPVSVVTSNTLRKQELGNKYSLALIYFLKVKQSKIGEFRKHAKQIGLSLQSIQNISFVSPSIVELLIKADQLQSFVDQAKSLGFQIKLDIDIATSNKHNPLWLEPVPGGASFNEHVRLNFIHRISHEIKSTTNENVRQYYWNWAKMLGFEKSLLLDSTRFHFS